MSKITNDGFLAQDVL